MLSKAFIDEVKSSVDIVELASQYADLKKVGDGIWQSPCPHPDHEDDTPSFTVWEKSQSWACMGCHSGRKDSKYKNYGSDCFAFVQWIEGLSWRNSVMALAEAAGISPEEDPLEPVYKDNYRKASAYHSNILPVARKYLASRGLDQKDAEKWMIGFDGSRITFPLFDRYKRVLGFTNRIFIEKEGAKYKNSPNSEIFNKSVYFYGIHNLDSEFKEIRITEGSMDVILAEKYGVKNVVATLGTSFTKSHVAIIKNLGLTPVFCMDGDLAGQKSAKKSIDILAEEGVYSKIFTLTDGMDMADFAIANKENTESIIAKEAVTYGQLMVNELVATYEAKMNEVKIQLYPELEKIIKEIPHKGERQVISDYVKERLNIRF